MKKLLVKAEFVVTPYSPAVPGIAGVEAQPEKWTKGEETVFEAPQNLTDWIYHPAVEGVEAVAEIPEQPEVKEWQVIAQTQGSDEELAIWLAGDVHKYPEGYQVEYIDISAEIQQRAAMDHARKAMECGKSAQAAMLVRNAAKNLTTDQVKQIVATYAPIKGLLDTGSLQSAIEEIQKIQADGVLVTQADKEAIIAHINQCRP